MATPDREPANPIPDSVLYPETNENGDVRCPYDGEWVNKRCWVCDWERKEESE
jgi:hypothetical protein